MKFNETDLDWAYAERCAQIDIHDVQGEYLRVSADLYYWTQAYAQALGKALTAEATRKDVSAALYMEWRSAKESGKDVFYAGKVMPAKSITEEVAKSGALLDMRYTGASTAEIDAETLKARVLGVVQSIQAKREILISLGADLRQQTQREPSINEVKG